MVDNSSLIVNVREFLEKEYVNKPRVCKDGRKRKVVGISLPNICNGVRTKILQYHTRGHIIVDFCAESSNPTPTLRVGHYNELHQMLTPNNNHIESVNKFLDQSIVATSERNVALVLTPEYSVPKSSLERFVANAASNLSNIPVGVLWALCCESINDIEYLEYIRNISSTNNNILLADICKTAIILSKSNMCKGFVCAMFYVCKLNLIFEGGSSEPTLVVIPQIKTRPMGAEINRSALGFESLYMTLGESIALFEDNSTRQFCTLLCSDAFNTSILSCLKSIKGGKPLLLSHPQLNRYPHYSLMKQMHTALIEDHSLETNMDVQIISLNWNENTTLQTVNNRDAKKNRTVMLTEAWSAFISKPNLKRGSSFDDYRRLTSRHAKYGIEYCRADRIGFWAFHPNTNEILYELDEKDRFDTVHYATIGTQQISSATDTCATDLAGFLCSGEHVELNSEIFQDIFICPKISSTIIGQTNCTNCSKEKLNEWFFSVARMRSKTQIKEFSADDAYKLHKNSIIRLTCQQFNSEAARENYFVFCRVSRWISGKLREKLNGMDYKYTNQKLYNVEFESNQANVIPDGSEHFGVKVLHLRAADLANAVTVHRNAYRMLEKSDAPIYSVIVLYEDSGENYTDEYVQRIVGSDMRNAIYEPNTTYAGLKSYPFYEEINHCTGPTKKNQLGRAATNYGKTVQVSQLRVYSERQKI